MEAIVPEKIVPSVIGQVEIEFARDKNKMSLCSNGSFGWMVPSRLCPV